MSKCPLCGGVMEKSTTTFVVDKGDNLIVIRQTPATVCSICAEEWIDDKTSEILEDIVQDAIKNKRVMEVVTFSNEIAA